MIVLCILAAAVASAAVWVAEAPRRHARCRADVLDALRAMAPGAYPVAIIDQVRTATGRRVSVASLYPVLADLEREGFVHSCWGERRAPDGPRRRLYFVGRLSI